MTLKCNIQGTGASAEHSEAICGELAPAISAAGTNQATATLLKRLTRHTVTTGAGGVILPGAPLGDNLQYGDEIEVTNACGTQIRIYPPTGANFYGLAANASILLPDGLSVSIVVYSATLFLPRYYVGSTGGGTGTVTSVGITAPTEVTVTNSPITGSGNIALSWTGQTQNKVFASPNGSSGTPAFRALVAADLPAGTTPLGANPTATAGPTAVNGSAATFMRSDGAPAIQKASSSVFGIVEVDGTSITATGGVISAVAGTGSSGANPTATAGDVAVNGSAVTFLRSDGAPAIQKGSSSLFGIVKVDNTTITASSGVISTPGGANPSATAGASAVNGTATTFMRSDGAPAIAANIRTADIAFIIDGGGSAITTGIKGDLQINFNCTIQADTVLLDQSGSIVIDIWKDTYANYPPTNADSICASAKPTVSSATKSTDSTLTGWTTSITAGDTLRFNVDSITTATRALINLKVIKT